MGLLGLVGVGLSRKKHQT
ncbi:MAG: hypothetical protein DRP68_04125 [Candidatus Omnitrophota bacterium]|nr:MAG: hypothetical protein DRP68_04125 [Candidatus Omnitrophota bacterium]